MRRRWAHRFFREFLFSLVIGFITGFVASQTVLVVLWRRQEQTCRSPWGFLRPTAQAPTTSSGPQENKLVFIGVMTTWHFLSSRADAIYSTWGKNVPGKLVFFVGTGESHDTSLPVIVLSEVKDAVYPPQRKSFAMLKYISYHYGNDYLWYMRLDDDVFINTNRLERFLKSVNSSQILYMGHPGTGKMEEKGQLGLHSDKPYCMGGPGVVFSQTALNMVTPYLSACLNDTVTSHEDSELGRCVERVTGRSCTLAKEFDFLFHQNYKDKSGEWTRTLKPETLAAISFHPIKQHAFMYDLNIRILGQAIKTLMKNVEHLKAEVNLYDRLTKCNPGDNCNVESTNSDPELIWSCVIGYDLFRLRSENLKDSVLRQGMVFGMAEARRALGLFLKNNRILKKLRIEPVSYSRISSRGLEHVIVTRDKKGRIWRFETLQVFDPLYFREISSVLKKT